MHPKNKHTISYDFKELTNAFPTLLPFVFTNKFKTQTIDFSNPKAVKALNTALLFLHYNINYWSFSDENLCPPIPSRADYLYYVNDLIQPKNTAIKILDIGTGASCIYPILGNKLFNWQFTATDIDKNSLKSAQEIISKNGLSNSISLRFQKDKTHILNGIISLDDKFTASICNPPFYKSLTDAKLSNQKKQKKLGLKSNERNFSGNSNELSYKGGEKAFLHTYLYESSFFKEQCTWFTSLVSKKENVKSMIASLEKLKATKIKIIPMQHGNKITRIVAWSFQLISNEV